MALRDPRSFKVCEGEISFPKDDDILAAILRGDRPTGYAVETYRAGRVIPAGRLPASASGVFVERGTVSVMDADAEPPASKSHEGRRKGRDGRAPIIAPLPVAPPATALQVAPAPTVADDNGKGDDK